MSLFAFCPEDCLGSVDSVDAAGLVVRIEKEERLRDLQVDQLVVVGSAAPGQRLIGMVSRILRRGSLSEAASGSPEDGACGAVQVMLVGTCFEQDGPESIAFRRSVAVFPRIGAGCWRISGPQLRAFLTAVSASGRDRGIPCLEIGHYSMDEEATVWLDGNRLFQRHAVIVGSTGSGKSWCVARILEQTAALKSCNAILFDIHGEYSTLTGPNFTHLKVAGPSDQLSEENVFLPYWLLTYEEMQTLMLERSDANAPNQARVFSQTVLELKQNFLEMDGRDDPGITVDSPIPYSLGDLIDRLEYLDTEMVPGVRGEKKGPYNEKLTRLIQRLKARSQDRRMNFMFSQEEELQDYGYMADLVRTLMQPAKHGKNGVRIIDFSEVPSDILPLVISLVARVVFFVQQWLPYQERHPIALFCDEAHLYIPAQSTRGVDASSLDNFARISKEGRKYGVALVVISQRPSEVHRTVLSQSNNYIVMRLTNTDDISVVKRLLPDSMGNITGILPVLDTGEALLVGDASLLPLRVRISPPELKPRSATIDFWDEWGKETAPVDLSRAVEALRRQSK